MTALTAERLRQVLQYDPLTGLFKRLGPKRGRAVGKEFAGCVRERGYIVIQVDGRLYRAHRLAWLYMTGSWPEQEIDHQDTDTANNRWLNLRDVPPKVNSQNTHKPNGIEHRPGRQHPYRARLWVDSRLRTVGSFKTEDEAKVARAKAKREWHPGYVPADSSQIVPQRFT